MTCILADAVETKGGVFDAGQSASPVVWGAKAIGSVIGRSERQAFYLLEKGLIPGRKVGSIWASERDALLAVGRDSRRAS